MLGSPALHPHAQGSVSSRLEPMSESAATATKADAVVTPVAAARQQRNRDFVLL
jgi:hypothetical protein